MLRLSCKSMLHFVKKSQRAIASVPTLAIGNEKKEEDKHSDLPESETKVKIPGEYKKSALVASAFASLKTRNMSRDTPSTVIDNLISKAETSEDLLLLVNKTKLSKRQALKIVTILGEWSTNGKVNIDKYEADPKFIHLCQLLGKTPSKPQGPDNVTDLSVVLNVTGDDEAARLVSTISLQQMIKVLTSLAAKKRRSTPLLRSLAFNIRNSTAVIDIKQGADILYSLAVLNFLDEVLLEKVCANLKECVPYCNKSAVIGSIATSLGLLRYKDVDLLCILCEWVAQNKEICRIQDLSALLQTLASVNHIPDAPENFIQTMFSQLKEEEFPSSVNWLDVVWSLLVLGQAGEEHISSVLSSVFIDKLRSQNGALNVSIKKKILNISGAARWTKGYKGPLVQENSDVRMLPLARSKEKQSLVTNVLDALSNLLPSAIYLRSNVDLGMGFVLDGECLVDAMMTPLPVIDRKTGEPIIKPQKGSRVAIMVWDYHDFTRGNCELNGAQALISRLISQSGYKILSVPYTEYNKLEKLTVRVQYLEKKLKLLVRPG